MHIKSNKGYDLHLEGVPSEDVSVIDLGGLIRLHPKDFHGIKPKLLVSEGDRVIKSQPIYFDKNSPDVMFTTFMSGVIDKIIYGNKRSIESIDIKIDTNNKDEKVFNSYKLDEIKKIDKEKIKENICSSGIWPVLRRRPFSKIAKPSSRPKSIFIKSCNTAPFSPSLKVVCEHLDFDNLQAGCYALSKLFNVDLHMFLPSEFTSEIFNKLDNINLHTFTGPHPSGNIGYHIANIDPIESKDTEVWYLCVQDLHAIGKLFLTGCVDWYRIVALGGHPDSVGNRHLKISKGVLLSDLIGNLDCDQYRLISGDVFAGKKINKDSSIGFYSDIVSVVKNTFRREFMGWLSPGLNKFSLSRTFLSSLFSTSSSKEVTTALNGSVRSIVPIGLIERMCNLDIMPSMLIKSIISKDIEMMEELGIYECDSEDFGLCSYIDASKMDIVEIVQRGLDYAEVEG